MSNFEGRKTKDLQLDNEGDVSIWEDGIPTGIIDGWKVNSLYKTLIEVLQIGQYQNTEAVSMIENVIKQNDEESEMFWNPNSCIMKDSHSYEEVDNCTSEIELKALYLWRTTRLSLSSIAFEVGAKLEDVATYVATYKKRVRQQLKSNKIRATQSRKVINNLKIEQVKGYWQSNSHKPLRISDIITSVWSQQGSKTPWHSTVSKVLKRNLRMSYRVLSSIHPKSTLQEQIRLYCESVMIWCKLISKDYEIIFVDEFHLSAHR